MVTTKESENIKLSYKKTILKLWLLNYLEIVKIARYKDCFPIKHEENIYCIPITENIWMNSRKYTRKYWYKFVEAIMQNKNAKQKHHLQK